MSYNAIAYLSSATRSFDFPSVVRVAQSSQANNHAKGITGYLYHHNDEFFQFIEGEESAIMSLYETISHDERHEIISHITISTYYERIFPEWTMRPISHTDLENAGILPHIRTTMAHFKEQPLQYANLAKMVLHTARLISIHNEREKLLDELASTVGLFNHDQVAKRA